MMRATLIALTLAPAFWSCGSDKVCGEGTELVDDSCVPVTACGEGTSEVDGVCVPDAQLCGCESRECGLDPCSGSSCGTCGEGETCQPDGQCAPFVCVPLCNERECGDDGCGGSCGSCDDPSTTCQDGQCLAACVPNCLGRECGDDGCGGTCGACLEGHDCSSHGHCVPDAWTCDHRLYDALDHCDCGCGAHDPDCDQPFLALVGCDLHEVCASGTCTDRVPAAWTCSPDHYGDGVYCECGCGAPDPDCDDERGSPLTLGCGPGEMCSNGTCTPCVADCDGRQCGDDGCGGTCGTCGFDPVSSELLACVDGACIPGCTPTPVLCETRSCGDDGCGGSCGTCPNNTTCSADGRCVIDLGASCSGRCGVDAPAGCGCDISCLDFFDCCPDFVSQCACVGSCEGRVCGDDGCGGSCGPCGGATPFCGNDGQCRSTCEPQCDGRECGDDGCGGTCGTCASGESCNDSDRCVPAAWYCPDHYYGDAAHCDCSCGAPDPDCERIGLTTGCPFGAACVDETGLCDVSFCTSDDDCGSPALCIGRYASGSGALDGVCRSPGPAGLAVNALCASDAGCSTEVCAAGSCRRHCRNDDDCLGAEVCIGVAVVQPLTGDPIGVLGVCDSRSSIGATCASQDECGELLCLALVDPIDQTPLYRCGEPLGGAMAGVPCDPAIPCALGLVCADGICERPCPGGQADCPAGFVCGDHPLYPAHATDPQGSPLIKVCEPL